MKTSVVMTRKLSEYDVLQRTGDDFFDGNALLTQWNANPKNTRRRMSEFLESPKTKEFLEALAEDESQRRKTDKADIQLVIKSKGKVTAKGKTPDKVWMSPLLFIKFAMYLNPRFEVQVLRFVYDELIRNRHKAGDNYKSLTSAVSMLPDVDYPNLAKALNYIVFNQHYNGIRNDATEEQLSELHALEEKLAFTVETGLVKSQAQLTIIMRKMWNEKYRKF